ncbi:MAG: hypothetical protein ACO3VF_00615 [Tamlana sp.]|jgi:hypothetical protein
MHKNAIAIFFSILLLALISAPSIIIAIDDSVDISMFYSIAEEEEETSKIKIQSPQDLNHTNNILALDNLDDIAYFFKKYPKPHLNLISPPPENYIL